MTLGIKNMMKLLAAAAICLMPTLAHAGSFDDSAMGDFANSPVVSDGELSQQRGGYIDLNGVLFSFDFSSMVDINGQNVASLILSSAQIEAALNGDVTASLPNDLITIIQNADPNVIISIQQQLDVTLIGAGAFASAQTQMGEMGFSNIIAIY